MTFLLFFNHFLQSKVVIFHCDESDMVLPACPQEAVLVVLSFNGFMPQLPKNTHFLHILGISPEKNIFFACQVCLFFCKLKINFLAPHQSKTTMCQNL